MDLRIPILPEITRFASINDLDTEMTCECKHIIEDAGLCNWAMQNIENQRCILLEHGFTPQSALVSNDIYEQLMLYQYKCKLPIYSEKLMGLNVMVNPDYKQYVNVICSNQEEITRAKYLKILRSK